MVLVAFYCVLALSKLNGTTTTSVSLGYKKEPVSLVLVYFLRISCYLQFALVWVVHLLVFAAPNSP